MERHKSPLSSSTDAAVVVSEPAIWVVYTAATQQSRLCCHGVRLSALGVLCRHGYSLRRDLLLGSSTWLLNVLLVFVQVRHEYAMQYRGAVRRRELLHAPVHDPPARRRLKGQP